MANFEEEIVAEIHEEFKRLRELRRPLELNWRLNMNFVIGNQFAEISARGDIEEYGKQIEDITNENNGLKEENESLKKELQTS